MMRRSEALTYKHKLWKDIFNFSNRDIKNEWTNNINMSKSVAFR